MWGKGFSVGGERAPRTHGVVVMLCAMSHTYRHCRDCKRDRDQVALSSRGRCAACAMAAGVTALGAAVATANLLRVPVKREGNQDDDDDA